MEKIYYNAVTELYNYVNSLLPEYDGNPCIECNICCGRIANLGVSELEFDYIEESLKENNSVIAVSEQQSFKDLETFRRFKNFIQGLTTQRTEQVCPFFDEKIAGCSIHKIRPLSCRTFGCFIGSSMMDMIPDSCLLKKNVVVYDESNFAEIMPFIHPFYSLIEKYRISRV